MPRVRAANALPSPGFRLKGKRFHLIYAQCNLDAFTIYDVLEDLGKPIVRARIANELHENGDPHRHVAIEFESAWDVRNANAHLFFDIEGHHPQIKPKRLNTAWRNAWEYCAKDNRYTDFGAPLEPEDDHESLVDEAQTQHSFTEYLRVVERTRRNPYLAKLIWDAVQRERGNDRTILDPDDPEELIGRISSPILRNAEYDGLGPNGPVSVILQGPSSIGKTTWAKLNAPKPALWVVHPDDLKLFRPFYHASIIIDDQCMQHTPRSNQLQWVDRRNPTSVHLRYVVAHIPAGVHRIFTCNLGQHLLPVAVGCGDDAIDARCHVLYLE